MNFFKKNVLEKIVPAQKERVWRDMYQNGGRLNIAASVSAEVARLVTLEMSGRIHGSKRAEFLDCAYQSLIAKSRNFCELCCAIGGVMLKPYVTDGKIETAIVPADSFKVTSISPDGSISGVQFFEYITEQDKQYVKCEEHLLVGDSYIITNTAYVDAQGIKKEVSLASVRAWSGLEKEVILEGVKHGLFAYFGMPFINVKDLKSPLGEPIFARSCDLIDDANRQYERLLWEFESGERALYVDETAVKRGARGEAQLPDKRLYRTLLTGNDELFQDWSPEIRDEAIINGLMRILQRIEFNCGLAYGTLSDPQAVDKTAEEIRASKQRSYATVTEIQTALKNAFVAWLRAASVLCDVYSLAPSGDYEMDIAFDDSIIADRKTEFEERMALLDKGVISTEEMKNWYMGKGTKIC